MMATSSKVAMLAARRPHATAAQRAADIDGHVARVVAGWPPLTKAQLDAVAVIFADGGRLAIDAASRRLAA